MKYYRLYQFIDKENLRLVYSSNDLYFLKNMKKILSEKYNINYLLVEVIL